MKITKFVHSCLLVETADRVALFDPGMMSEQALNIDAIDRLDDIIITHIHGDHISDKLITDLTAKFPNVRITATPEVVAKLKDMGVTATDQPSEGIVFFDAPHESVEPLFPPPQEIGVHYLQALSDPGDSHSFNETMPILALPMQAPWGSTVDAINLALKLKPQHVLPIHDWHWRDEARQQIYDRYIDVLAEQGIKFHKLETGVPVEIDI